MLRGNSTTPTGNSGTTMRLMSGILAGQGFESVLIGVGNRVAALPADNFSVSGETLVSAMSRAEVRKAAREGNTAN